MRPALALIVLSVSFPSFLPGQALPLVQDVEPQPLVAQVVRLGEALSFLGSRLDSRDWERIQALRDQAPSDSVVREIQTLLDPYCLAMVSINPEARVKVLRGPAAPLLVQGGWTSFLVKIENDAAVNAQLHAESPNALPLFHKSTGAKRVKPENVLSDGDVANRFLELAVYGRRPLRSQLSGLKLEYAIIQIYTREQGLREAKIGFHVGQGTQDLGFRNSVDVLFDCRPAVRVRLRVKDHDGTPTMASFVITDGIERVIEDPELNRLPSDYRLARALRRPWDRTRGIGNTPAPVGRLVGVYPLPSRRLSRGEYPDFYFHPQIYRADGEHVFLPAGEYEIQVSRGPEYLVQNRRVRVRPGVEKQELEFRLERWTHLAALGWYSADHHVHAAGCSHYESPDEGVQPSHMWRQALGEDLNIACVLTWGPCWYHQKQNFEGRVHSLSTRNNLMRYDVEVSGFPSSHAGHLCLLRLREDDYPGTTRVQQWPSWTLPVLQWGQGQGAVVGYSHSGWGLEPMEFTTELPNYVMAKFDGIGANEYIVTVTQDAVDFFSAGDTPAPWELNIWYHVLNSGFRTRLSGETDFPCIFDDRVGMARSYAKLDGPLNFDRYMDQIRAGRSYVSDGASHIVDFSANGLELGTRESQLNLPGAQTVEIRSRVAVYLPIRQDEVGAIVASRRIDRPPYWHIERARLGKTRQVPVELIVNGEPVAKKMVEADGQWREVSFTHPVKKSSWLALRIYPSSHTNPIFVQVDGKPVRASRRSAEWCRRAVDQCWKMKSPRIRPEEREQAAAAYERARLVYDRIVRESRP
jgi:hypothetical protein